jgi:hypothetical protein
MFETIFERLREGLNQLRPFRTTIAVPLACGWIPIWAIFDALRFAVPHWFQAAPLLMVLASFIIAPFWGRLVIALMFAELILGIGGHTFANWFFAGSLGVSLCLALWPFHGAKVCQWLAHHLGAGSHALTRTATNLNDRSKGEEHDARSTETA